MATTKTAMKKAALNVGLFLTTMVIVPACSHDLTYKDFQGKALKERTIEELKQAKFNLEHGYEINVTDFPESKYRFRKSSIEVPELKFETKDSKFKENFATADQIGRAHV